MNHKGHRFRLKKKFLSFGTFNLKPHELLELDLFFAIPRKDTNGLAHSLLDKFGTIHGVLNAKLEELRSINGLEESAALFLKLQAELYNRIYHNGATESELQTLEYKDIEINNYGELVTFIKAKLRETNKETFLVIMTDRHNKISLCDVLFYGTPENCGFDIPNAIKSFYSSLFPNLIVAHNHFEDTDIPSMEDVIVTKKIRKVLKSSHTKLRDHIIITPSRVFSVVKKTDIT